MPDPKRTTLSATEVPGLFGYGYQTHWMLYQKFVNNLKTEFDAGDKPDNRMWWGNKLEPIILEATEQMLRVKIKPNNTYFYHPDGLAIGATTDAIATDPSLGEGVVDAKNVDYFRWRDEWSKENAPMHIEIQLCVQMMVHNVQWGCIACCINGNELILYRRTRNKELEEQIIEAVNKFWDDIHNENEPSPTGEPKELPMIKAWLEFMADKPPKEVVKVDDASLLQKYDDMKYHKTQRTMHEKIAKALESELQIAAAKGELVKIPGAEMNLKITEISKKAQEATTYKRKTLQFRKHDMLDQ